MLSPDPSPKVLALVLAAVLALSACGGGSPPRSPAPDCGTNACPALDSARPPLLDALTADLAAELSQDLAPEADADVPPDSEPDAPDDGPPVPLDDAAAPDADLTVVGISPALHEFNRTTVGSTDPFRFTVTNRGGNTLTALSLTINGVDFALAPTSCDGAALNAGASCQFDVLFKPLSRGSKSGTLIVSASGETVMAPLTGTGLTAPQLAISPMAQSFTGQVGKTSLPVSFTVANVGDVPTSAVSVALDGADFIVTSNTCLPPLGMGAACTVQVAFKPVSLGMKVGALFVLSANGTEGMPQSQLTGTALAATGLTVTPDAATFMPTSAGSISAAKGFMVKNTGGSATAPLTVSVSTGEFVITANTCAGASLPMNDTCSVAVAFAPSTSGGKVALLTVSGGASEIAQAQLGGTGL
jgi:hypothetical protein